MPLYGDETASVTGGDVPAEIPINLRAMGKPSRSMESEAPGMKLNARLKRSANHKPSALSGSGE